jgi:hypothetical protein
MVVRIILPTIRKDVTATRHGEREKIRKIAEYLLSDRSRGSVAAR